MMMGYRDLLALWRKRVIRFEPDIDPRQQIGLSSIDLRLGYLFTKQRVAPGYTIDPFDEEFDPSPLHRDNRSRTQPRPAGQGANFILKPDEFVLSRTLETVHIPPISQHKFKEQPLELGLDSAYMQLPLIFIPLLCSYAGSRSGHGI